MFLKTLILSFLSVFMFAGLAQAEQNPIDGEMLKLRYQIKLEADYADFLKSSIEKDLHKDGVSRSDRKIIILQWEANLLEISRMMTWANSELNISGFDKTSTQERAIGNIKQIDQILGNLPNSVSQSLEKTFERQKQIVFRVSLLLDTFFRKNKEMRKYASK